MFDILSIGLSSLILYNGRNNTSYTNRMLSRPASTQQKIMLIDIEDLSHEVYIIRELRQSNCHEMFVTTHNYVFISFAFLSFYEF